MFPRGTVDRFGHSPEPFKEWCPELEPAPGREASFLIERRLREYLGTLPEDADLNLGAMQETIAGIVSEVIVELEAPNPFAAGWRVCVYESTKQKGTVVICAYDPEGKRRAFGRLEQEIDRLREANPC